MGKYSNGIKKLIKPVITKFVGSSSNQAERKLAEERLGKQLQETIQNITNKKSSYEQDLVLDKMVNAAIKQRVGRSKTKAKPFLDKYKEFKDTQKESLENLYKREGETVNGEQLANHAFGHIFDPGNEKAMIIPLIKKRTRSLIKKNASKSAQQRIENEIASARNIYDSELARLAELYPNQKGIFKNAWDKAVDWTVKNPKAFKAIETGTYTLPFLGGAYGIYSTLSDDPQETAKKAKKKMNLGSSSKYRWTPEGWQQNVNGNWVDQTSGYGVDRFGNTNFYDEQTGTWLKPGQYYQSSNGLVFTSDGNRQIGYNTGADAAQAADMGTNIFDYYAQSHGFSPQDTKRIKMLQQALGVSTDGKWGQQTENAYNAAIAANPNFFTVMQ